MVSGSLSFVRWLTVAPMMSSLCSNRILTVSMITPRSLSPSNCLFNALFSMLFSTVIATRVSSSPSTVLRNCWMEWLHSKKSFAPLSLANSIFPSDFDSSRSFVFLKSFSSDFFVVKFSLAVNKSTFVFWIFVFSSISSPPMMHTVGKSSLLLLISL